MSELLKRVLVAIVGIPFAIFAIWNGGIIFAVSIMIISSLALLEYYKMIEKKSFKPDKIWGIFAGLILQATLFYKISSSNLEFFLFIEILLFILFTLIFELFARKGNAVLNITSTVTGPFYVSLLLGTLILIREFPGMPVSSELIQSLSSKYGNKLYAYFVMSMFISVWICDSAAFFIGKKFGKHKLFPSVSPKKSWEGAIAGFIASILGMFAFMNYTVPEFPAIHSILLGAIIGIFGQIGDLAESLLKRDAGIKDSSSILPGHGGFLDRFDSIIFVSPLCFIYLYLIIS